MTSRQRVIETLYARPVDRVPLNVFAGWNVGTKSSVLDKYGSINAFMDEFHIDIVTGVVPRFPFGDLSESEELPGIDDYLSMEITDPLSTEILAKKWWGEMFLSVNDALDHHKTEMGEKAVIAHVWGVLELTQFLFEKKGAPGMEDALILMITEQEKSARLYMKLAEWSAGCIENAARAGVDIIQISDDWGQENTMLFNPKLWWDLIYPATKIIIDMAEKHGLPVIIHSDGDITQVLDGVKKLKVNGLHPVQESAGMTPKKTRHLLGNNICIMGGLDIVSALPVMNEIEIREEVNRIFSEYSRSGPYIFSGSHMFQDDTHLEVIEAAYREAYKLAPFV